MKVIICGAGKVGTSIAKHLVSQNNDVTVIDDSAENIQRITDHYDVHGVVGVASHPDRLAEAGVRDAELLIAVTESDEVNMVACQVSHTIFNTPVKIARIRGKSYLDPAFGELYGEENLPIDHIISPEAELSAAASPFYYLQNAAVPRRQNHHDRSAGCRDALAAQARAARTGSTR